MSEQAKPSRVCPECGSDRWQAREASRDRQVAFRLRQAADEIARENGLLRFKLSVAEAAVKDTQSLLQRKITRQARVIRRMEERLRARGEKPYEGAPLGETAPGAEYDASQAIDR